MRNRLIRPFAFLSGLSILLALLGAPAFSQEAAVAVDFGKYPSAEAAAQSEVDVNWTDGDYADDTICTVSFAASELRAYLERMAGTAIRVVKPGNLTGASASPRIFYLTTLEGIPADLKTSWGMGNLPALKELGPEGYVMKTIRRGGKSLVLIAGGGRVGTLYGAYDFLHRLGVRWFAPGQDNEVVPALSLDKIPELDITESPKMFTRGFHAWENRADPDFLLWMARNRLNYWCVEQEPKPLLHKLGIMLVGGAHVLTSLYLGPDLEYPYDHSRFSGDEKKPADPYPVSPEYKGDADGNGRLTYFEAHPEWYGLINGKRSNNIKGDFGDNFCTSNADAVAEFNKNAVEDLATGRYKDAQFMNAWVLDYGKWCECDACKALGTQTDRNLLFIHHYAQAIKKAQAAKKIHRPVRLLFLAYADVLEPPTKPMPADFDYDMCIATYFPIRRCYVHLFDDPLCTLNGNYLENLRGWAIDPARHYKGQIAIGEYYNVSGYKCLPVCFMHSMAKDIPFYYSIGARHFHYMHVTTRNMASKALTNWQMARQVWNPAENCEALWTDYFRNRYGTAQTEMRAFYETLEKMLENVSELKYNLGRLIGRGQGDLFPDNHLKYAKTTFPKDDGPDLVEILDYAKKARSMMDAVQKKALPSAAARRIAEDERAFAYAERTVFFYDALCRVHDRLAEKKWQEAKGPLQEAVRYAALLKADTIATQYSSSHANAADALEASYAAPALERYRARIEELEKSEKAAAQVQNHDLLKAIRDPRDWEKRRARILENMQLVTGPFPDDSKKVSLEMQTLESTEFPDMIRRKITFAVEAGDRVPAYLFIPKNLKGKAAAVLCLHQTIASGKGEPSDHDGKSDKPYALELAKQGFVTLAPDYPGYGDYKIDPYAMGYVSATMKGIWNHMRAVDLLRSLPEVDPERIAVIGHSLGGHNSIFAAVFDERIKAVVTSCGFTSFPKYYRGDLTGWSHKGYMPRIATDFGKDPRRMPFDFHELLAALAPRPVFINAPLKDDNFDFSGVDDCVKVAAPVYSLLGGKGRVTVVHPDIGHGFPPEIRKQAYAFLGRILGK